MHRRERGLRALVEKSRPGVAMNLAMKHYVDRSIAGQAEFIQTIAEHPTVTGDQSARSVLVSETPWFYGAMRAILSR